MWGDKRPHTVWVVIERGVRGVGIIIITVLCFYKMKYEPKHGSWCNDRIICKHA